MTSHTPQPARYPTPPFTPRPAAPHPGLRAAAITELVIAILIGLGWMFVGIGVAMCTDGRTTAYCNSVTTRYQLAGWALGLNLAVGVTVLVVGASARSRAVVRVMAGAIVAALVFVAVAAALLLSFI